ncbi:MAG: restriction endonuclease subunit S [Clostridia bacterium]|nr:restriction endonuclease subunit S [Clostridia bacterium]MDY5264422.1 restriction endonuclease subunit S [Eubacteriales bacterium]MDY5440212.1 restriction endonuclease subunit S [Eubacteriales bacterium]
MEEEGGHSVVNVLENPATKWCSVTLSDVIDRGKRLEASVFDVEAKQARDLILKGKNPVAFLGGNNGLTSSYTGARFKRIWLKKSNLPIYQPSSIVDIKPTPDGYISHLTQVNIDNLRVRKGQILMTCSGTIGKVSLVSNTLDNCIFSHDLLRINCNNDLDIGYIYTYLKSRVGNKILLTNSYGAVITHIEPEHLASVPIPNAPEEIKKKIHDLIMRSYELRDESNELLDKAEQILVEEMKLPPIEEMLNAEDTVETFNVKLSELNKRADASYHVPVVKAIVKHLKEHAGELTTIGDERISKKIILAGVFKRTYVEEEYGYPFLGGKEITQLNPKTEKYLSKAVHKARYEKELRVSENMILVSDRGTIGTVALVPKHWNNYAVSQNVLKVIPSNNNIAGYLYVFLNSEYGKLLTCRETYGSVVDMIDNHSLATIEFPLLKDKTKQAQINALALEANDKRYQAYCLEQEALTIMNKEVLCIE